jgi:hypothetical protein
MNGDMDAPSEQGSPSMLPRDWLLLLFDGADQPLDRVRIQKTMFLFAMRSKAPEAEKYDFVPYHYGPFSFGIYPDLDRLAHEGLVRMEIEPASRSPRYTLTGPGRQAIDRLRAARRPARLELVSSLRQWVEERSFKDLLSDVYRLYPQYAVNSVFRRS